MKTPNYVLIEDVQVNLGVASGGWNMPADYKVLPAGSFVRPINYDYVPKHVLEDPKWKNFNSEKEIFCYTKLGFIAIEKKMLRER